MKKAPQFAEGLSLKKILSKKGEIFKNKNRQQEGENLLPVFKKIGVLSMAHYHRIIVVETVDVFSTYYPIGQK